MRNKETYYGLRDANAAKIGGGNVKTPVTDKEFGRSHAGKLIRKTVPGWFGNNEGR